VTSADVRLKASAHCDPCRVGDRTTKRKANFGQTLDLDRRQNERHMSTAARRPATRQLFFEAANPDRSYETISRPRQ
jgi:hypothetical protein